MYSMPRFSRRAFISKVVVLALTLSTITLLVIPSAFAITVKRNILEYPLIMDNGDGDTLTGFKMFEYPGFGPRTSINPDEALTYSEDASHAKKEIHQIRPQIMNWLLFYYITRHQKDWDITI